MRKSREELAQMGSEELKEILRLDSQGVEEYPTEDILYMLDLLGQREEETGEVHVDVDAAWRRFQRDYLQREEEPQAPVYPPKVRRWQRLPRGLGATAAALALAFVGLLTARAAGWDILGGLAKWNDEIFTFGSSQIGNIMDVEPVESIFASGEQSQRPTVIPNRIEEYDTLQEALDACGITEVKAPTWLPEGCQSQTAEQTCGPDGIFHELYARYEYQGKPLTIDIFPSGRASADVEKIEGAVDITDMYGQTVYIIENTLDYTVAWKTESYEYYCSGPDRQVLEGIVASMLQ